MEAERSQKRALTKYILIYTSHVQVLRITKESFAVYTI